MTETDCLTHSERVKPAGQSFSIDPIFKKFNSWSEKEKLPVRERKIDEGPF